MFLFGGVANADCSSANSVKLAKIHVEWDRASAARANRDYKTIKADEVRLETVRQLVREGSACSVDDQYFASMVLLESDEFADIDLAYQMAERALSGGHPDALPLVARAVDTSLIAQGFPQKYGTQLRQVDGSDCLIEISNDLSDAQRAQYGQPAIADVYRQFLDDSGHTDVEASAKGLKKAGLSCKAVSWTTGKTMARGAVASASKLQKKADDWGSGFDKGELWENASLTPQGEFLIHPLFARSSYGLPGRLDVKVGLLSLIFAFDASIEAGLVQSRAVRISVEPFATQFLRTPDLLGGGHLRASFGAKTALNLAGGVTVISGPEYLSQVLNVQGGLDVPLPNGESMVRVYSRVGHSLADRWGPARTSGGGEIVYTTELGERFRIEAGAGLFVGPNPFFFASGAEDTLQWTVTPYPHLAMWWRI